VLLGRVDKLKRRINQKQEDGENISSEKRDLLDKIKSLNDVVDSLREENENLRLQLVAKQLDQDNI
jgi:chromosome segregation ATPase